MNKNNNKVALMLTFLLIFSISISIVTLQGENRGLLNALGSTSNSSSSIIAEKNSTFTNSNHINNQDVTTVFVIPNPGSNPDQSSSSSLSSSSLSPSDTTTTTSNSSSENPLNVNKSQPTNQNGTLQIDDPTSSLDSGELMNQQQKNVNNSANQNELQRGEYLVDNNGIHYYNIKNCSLVKGSSGIGQLSECEDAEREIREEMSG